MRERRNPYEPPHPQRDRHRCRRPAEARPACESGDARSLDHVHLRGRAHRTASGITNAPMSACARHGPTPWRCGTRSARSRIQSGRAAITIPIRSVRAFGGRVVITLDDGTVIEDELARRGCSSAWRASVRAASDYIAQVPHARRWRHRAWRSRSGSWSGATLAELRAGGSRRPHHSQSTADRLGHDPCQEGSSDGPDYPDAATSAKRCVSSLRPGGCCGSRARSRRWSRGSSTTSDSRASTFPAPRSQPTSRFRTSD